MGSTRGLDIFIITICLASSLFRNVSAQTDSASFEPEVFQTKDLLIREFDKSNHITSANRIHESGDELPLRTIVVTKDEIRRNGFTTLVDVLKTLPGFRTSQPGSAQLGETFLMRGLVGNIYTKILVNGIPVEPSVTPGMAISAQLPIQAAERIEITLGPAGSVFGADAMAGVINIVMDDIDRPIEAYGGASLGSQRTSYLHLSLGGKLGKAKNVVDYNFYAASWSRDDINFLWERDDLSTVRYAVVDDNPYWKGDPDNDSIPNFREMPQNAQMLGISLAYRGLSYNFQYMTRHDPSGLGSHVTDVDYSTSNAFYGDVLQTHQLKYQKSSTKIDFTTNLSGIIYELDENSSYVGIAHPISADRNFMYGSSLDLQLEQLVNYRPGEKWNILFGANGSMNSGESFQNYLNRPYADNSALLSPEGQWIIENSSTDSLSIIEDSSIFNEYRNINYAVFSQVYYRSGKWKLIGGLRYDHQSYGGNSTDFANALSPKFGVFFKQSKKLRFRGMVARGFRAPGNYYITNNYRGDIDPMDSSFIARRFEADLEPEYLTNFEVGLDLRVNDKWDLSFHTFYHFREKNLIPKLLTPDDLFGEDPPPGGPGGSGGPGGPPPGIDLDERVAGNYEIGYFNANSSSRLVGIQGFLSYGNDRWLRAELFGQLNFGSEQIEFENLDSLGEEDTYTVTEASFASMPDVMGGLNLHLNIVEGVYLSVYTKVFGEFRWALQLVNDSLLVKPSQGGYYNVDAVASLDLSKRLTFYVRMNNVTRSSSKGIHTSSFSGYQFPYIPQPGRTFLGGLTFDLNRKE